MFHSHGVILVDNEKPQLKQLTDAFISAGFPCLPIHYKNEPGNNSGLDHVVNVPDHTRIIFIDLNLTDSSAPINASDLVGPVAHVIKKIITNDAPYFLVFWSKLSNEPKEVMQLIYERYSTEIKMPIAWDVISKVEFQVGGKVSTSKKTIEKLKTRINKILNSDPLFSAMLDWEKRVADAARDTFGSLSTISKPYLEEGTPYDAALHKSNFCELLTSIAQASVGFTHAKKNPELAVDKGLLPVLTDKLSTLNNSGNLKDAWKKALPGVSDSIALAEQKKSALNNFFLIEEVEVDHSRNGRGVFVELNKNIREGGNEQAKFLSHLGAKSIAEILSNEFLSVGGTSAQKKKVREATRLGFVEISPGCDHANNKIRLNRYLLCALIPYEFEEYTYFPIRDSKEKNIKAHQGIHRLPPVNIFGESYIVKLSFKYQIGTHVENKWLGSPIFRFRDQVLSEVSVGCSQYASRLGIMSV